MSNYRIEYPWTLASDTLTTAGIQTIKIDSTTAGNGGSLYLPSITTGEAGIGARIVIIDPSSYISGSGITIYPSTSDTGYTINGASSINHTRPKCPLVLTYEDGEEWLASVSSGGSGTTYYYDKTLFVDPNGNDSTAVVGDLSHPWQSITAALIYLNTNGFNGYNVHVFAGSYAETNYIDLNILKSVFVQLEAGVSISVDLSAYGGANPWIAVNGARFHITGSSDINTAASIFVASTSDYFMQITPNSVAKIDNVDVSNSTISTHSATIGTISMSGGQCIINNSRVRNINGTEAVAICASGNLRANLCSIYIQNSFIYSIINAVGRKGTISLYGSAGHVLEMYNSRIMDAYLSKALIYADKIDSYVLMDDCAFYSGNATSPATYWNDDTTGTANLYIGSRCISNSDLPATNGCTLLNPWFGDLDCLLSGMKQPII